MTADQEVQRSIEEHGFAIREAVLAEDAVAALLVALDGIDESSSVRKREAFLQYATCWTNLLLYAS